MSALLNASEASRRGEPREMIASDGAQGWIREFRQRDGPLFETGRRVAGGDIVK